MNKKVEEFIVIILSVASLALVNMLSINYFTRIDLTADGVFTLSEASRKTCEELEDPITVRAYFSKDIPPQFESNRRYLQDLLDEYHAASNGMVSYEFLDPQAQETAEDREKKKEVKTDIFGRRIRERTSVELELEQVGIQPVEIRVIEDDAAQTKRAYMGIVIRYQEETEVIPVVQDTSSIEYDLTTIIRKLVRTKVPVLGVLQGRGEPKLDEDLGRLNMLLAQNYEVRPFELKGKTEIDADIDALLVVGNTEPYSQEEQKAIDQFLKEGKSAAFLLDLINMDFETFQPTQVNHGFDDMMATYGIEMGNEMVADVECASLTVSERRGFMVVQRPVQYPFVPQARFMNPDSMLTRGLVEIALPFALPIYTKEVPGVEIEVLLKSSPKSWLEGMDPQKMDPRRNWGETEISVTGPYELMATAKGRFPSHFGLKETVEEASKEPGESRLFVVGTSGIVKDQFLNNSNAAMVLNIVDWMLLDPAFLAMRTRGLTEAPLKPDLEDSTRNLVKYGNVVGIPGLLALYGLVRWQSRNRKRKRYTA
jgi:gliding-associated putative ABC transporter substrate-binding component GldG